MMTRYSTRMARFVLTLGVVALVAGQSVHAQDLTKFEDKCRGDKQNAAAKYCKSVLKAWAKWDKLQDPAKLADAFAKATGKLDTKWGKAEDKASKKGVDCTLLSGTASELAGLVDAAAVVIKEEINDGLDLGEKAQRKCGMKLINAAAIKCLKYVKAESKYYKKPEKDPNGVTRDAAQLAASQKFSEAWTKFGAGCPTTATESGIEARVDAINSDVIFSTTEEFVTMSPTGTVNYEGTDFAPTCIFDTPYHFFAKRGRVNKLLMYYEGGGACWEIATCGTPVCKIEVDPVAGNPANFASGLGDWTNPDNPFYGWHVVYVPYCTCDVHFGDSAQDYTDPVNPGDPPLHVEHRGYHNAKVAEKWAREHFAAPDKVFVTGSSAGAYGAIFQAPLLHDVWPAADFSVLGDAGNGVITQDFLENEFENWNFAANLPDIPGVAESMGVGGTGMPGYVEAVADYFPTTNWAHYTAAFDGGSGGQTGFYNVMLNNNNPLYAILWWGATCAWNAVMTQQAIDTYNAVELDNGNYRYYIASGSAHTGFGRDRAYTDTTGGVPPFVDWVNAMIDDTPAWTNVEADPNNVLFKGECSSGSDNPGDPCDCDDDCPNGSCSGEDVRPPADCGAVAPFEWSGDDMIVNCASPSGAFLGVAASVLD